MKIFLSSITESNCPLNLGKVAYYRCTNPAIVGETGLEPIRTMYTSPHSLKISILLYVTITNRLHFLHYWRVYHFATWASKRCAKVAYFFQIKKECVICFYSAICIYCKNNTEKVFAFWLFIVTL